MNEELGKGEKAMYFKEGMLDENPSHVFSKAISSYIEGDEETAKNLMEKIKDNLDFLVDKFLKDEEQLAIASVSKRTLVNITIKLLLLMDCEECFFNLVKKIYKSLEISLAVSRNIKEKKLVEWIKDMLKGEYKTEALYLIKDMGEKEQKLFIDEILTIAKEEVETPQYLALDILQTFVDKEEVKSLFMNFASDWDKNVRSISIMALSKFADEEEVKEILEEVYDDERDETIKFMIKTILKRSEKADGKGKEEDKEEGRNP